MPDKKLDPQASVGQKQENIDLGPHGGVTRKSFIGAYLCKFFSTKYISYKISSQITKNTY